MKTKNMMINPMTSNRELNDMPYRILPLLCLLAVLGGLAGCNTVEGFGKDVEAAGEAIDDTADNVEEEMED